jgi:phosphatidylcholine synthase
MDEPSASLTARIGAFPIHILTASGAAVGLISTLEAVRHHWAAMFGWLGLALFIDAVDGPLARRFRVRQLLPNWSGDALDFVVDFITYVFVPAFVIAESDLVWQSTAVPLAAAVVISSALYFADSRMKTSDNYFRGFPALWNAAILTLFVLRLPQAAATMAVVVLIVLTFVPIHVLHPLRVVRGRIFNLCVTLLWAALALWAIVSDFTLPFAAGIVFCLIGVYFLFGDLVVRGVQWLRS